jgi:hypothetical protein
VLGEDRPGRRHGGRNPPTTLRPAWLETPIPPSCALDVADAVATGREYTIDEMAAMLGIRSSSTFQLLADALQKLRSETDPRDNDDTYWQLDDAQQASRRVSKGSRSATPRGYKGSPTGLQSVAIVHSMVEAACAETADTEPASAKKRRQG